MWSVAVGEEENSQMANGGEESSTLEVADRSYLFHPSHSLPSLSPSLSLLLWLLPLPPPKQPDNRAIRPARYLVAMAWLEQCEVCGGGGFFCCHRSPDLNQAAAGGGRPGVLQEFQFFGRQGAGGGVAWLANGADAGDTVSDDRTPAPPLPGAPTTTAAWEDTDCRRDYYSPRWPTLESCSVAASLPEPATGSSLVDASNLGPVISAAATTMALGSGEASNPEAGEADKSASSGKDDSGSSMGREARVLRYLEKKKRRHFGKQIRYASRKAYAETRPRIRGRFAKAPEAASNPIPSPHQYDPDHVGVGWFSTFLPRS